MYCSGSVSRPLRTRSCLLPPAVRAPAVTARLLAALLALVVLGLVGGQPASAQASPDAERVQWRVDPSVSLAWWQVDPHYSHLWATTCPDDPSWQPGEGRSSGKRLNFLARKRTVDADRSDDRVPLYPRERVHVICREAVSGELAAADRIDWSDLEGTVQVLADSLTTGLDLRDGYAARAVFETGAYPRVEFAIDSIVSLEHGDALRAEAMGTLRLHGESREVSASVEVREFEEDGLRVLARFELPAKQLTSVYGMSRTALGMGIIMGRWKTVHAGVDLVLRPVAATADPSPTSIP